MINNESSLKVLTPCFFLFKIKRTIENTHEFQYLCLIKIDIQKFINECDKPIYFVSDSTTVYYI